MSTTTQCKKKQRLEDIIESLFSASVAYGVRHPESTQKMAPRLFGLEPSNTLIELLAMMAAMERHHVEVKLQVDFRGRSKPAWSMLMKAFYAIVEWTTQRIVRLNDALDEEGSVASIRQNGKTLAYAEKALALVNLIIQVDEKWGLVGRHDASALAREVQSLRARPADLREVDHLYEIDTPAAQRWSDRKNA